MPWDGSQWNYKLKARLWTQGSEKKNITAFSLLCFSVCTGCATQKDGEQKKKKTQKTYNPPYSPPQQPNPGKYFGLYMIDAGCIKLE